MAQHKLPLALLVWFILLLAWSAINPYDLRVWTAEIIPSFAFIALLAGTYHLFRFSNTAYLLMAIWATLHTIGSHYTFANVPFDWFNNLIGSERNQFDRVAHFSIGFYAFPMAEWLSRRKLCSTTMAVACGLGFIMAVAAAYEVIEWLFVVLEGGEAGIEFLGAQGDIWDAQKDILADTCGALVSLMLFLLVRPDQAAAAGGGG